ncbi:MAG: DUF362 domain-containing protein, partial [Proteobacteria bacterium]|nr:DUF362 domain-containing protein [Pseudomonadota bacterium]
EETGAKLKNFEIEGVEKVRNDQADILNELFIAKPVLEADVILSLCKLKSHEQTLFTGAVKNMFGVIPGGGKRLVHKQAVKADELCRAILDIYSMSKPHICLMDAIVGMEGPGPAMGFPKKIGLILSSSDGIALDAIASSIVGYDPLEIGTIKFGFERGLGIKTLSEIETRGETISDVSVSDFKKVSNDIFDKLPTWLVKYLVSGFQNVKPYPKRNEDCESCSICVDSCPVDALALKDNGTGVVMDEDLCIRCFCCRELCPEQVFELKRSRLSKMIFNRVYN